MAIEYGKTTGSISNLNYLRVKISSCDSSQQSIAGIAETSVDSIEFEAISKDLPGLKGASTWTVLTDDPAQWTADSFKGKTEGFNEFSVVIPTHLGEAYGTLQKMALDNLSYVVELTYNDGETEETLQIPKCFITAVTAAGGQNNGASQTTVTFLPRGGQAENMPRLA